jgi:hypothetical protein
MTRAGNVFGSPGQSSGIASTKPTRSLTGARAPERQAGGPRGRADRAKNTSRRTYRASNSAVSESQRGRIIAGTESSFALGCSDDPAAAETSDAQLGPMRRLPQTRNPPSATPSAASGIQGLLALAVLAHPPTRQGRVCGRSIKPRSGPLASAKRSANKGSEMRLKLQTATTARTGLSAPRVSAPVTHHDLGGCITSPIADARKRPLFAFGCRVAGRRRGGGLVGRDPGI